MLDPILLQQWTAKPTAELFHQLTRLDPELAIPAALPLLAARLLGAAAEDEDDDLPEPELATA
jgi:hypothetical protein